MPAVGFKRLTDWKSLTIKFGMGQKKLGGVLKAPHPNHSQKDPAAANDFRKTLPDKLAALALP